MIEQARHARPPPGSLAVVAPSTQKSHAIKKPPTAAEPDIPPDEDCEATVARPENTHTIEIEKFLPLGQIDARYYEKHYYITPRDFVGQEAYAVIRDAMREEGVAGIGRVVLASREHPMLIEPMGNGLRGITLRFTHEVRNETDYFRDIPEMTLPPEMLKLARHIIEAKAAHFDPSMLEDHYRKALVEILRKKQARQPHLQAGQQKPSPENVINLMDALRRSLSAARPPAKSVTQRGSNAKSNRSKRSNSRSRDTR